MTRLDDLIAGLPVTLDPPDAGSIRICDITEDSRTAMPGSLFIARSGGTHDGTRFIADAATGGAVAVLRKRHTSATPALAHHDVHSEMATVWSAGDDREVARIGAIIAERFYGSPSSSVRVVGVTGTNGKSTITHMVHRLLKHAGVGAGLIGTVEIDDGREVSKATMTTPPATEMSYLLSNMREHGCAAAAIEISSHALDQGRADGIRVEIGVFTNLTGDHLDYHKSTEEYARCKAHLFEMLPEDGLAVVNADDPWHARMIENCAAQIIRTSIIGADADASARLLTVSAQGTRAEYAGPWGSIEATSPFIGEHNVSNALQALVCAHRLGLTRDQLERGLARLTTPAGRLECVSEPGDGMLVLVDYAHSDDSIAHALASVRPVAEQTGGRVICVFGCGGDRDKTKRPRMGRAAAAGADVVFITSDNPRTERPGAIIDEIRAGMTPEMLSRCRVDADRRRAIVAAVNEARGGDVVVIAGKGHEDYQILPNGSGGTERIHFDDREEARRALEARRSAIVEMKHTYDFWTAGGIARATGGELTGEPGVRLTGVCTDTRAITSGCVFVALVGERFDAHDFVRDAVQKGAACVVVHNDAGDPAVPVIRVRDTGAALMDMGAAWRRELTRSRVIAVTGSNGKTTTCRMIDAVLGVSLTGRASIKSFNNAIGVPLTVLGAKETDDYLVAEAGMNAPGEMEPLSRVLTPDIAVIASIGRAHIGAFPDGVLGIAREKAQLAAHLAPGGVIVATADSPELREVLGNDPRVVWVGEADDSDVRVVGIEPTEPGTTFRADDQAFTVPAPGRHNALNAALAVVVARRMGLVDDAIRQGLARFIPPPMRLQRLHLGGVTVINDAYNANPDSMIAALRHFAESPVTTAEHGRGRRVAVLGQMLEMGDHSDALHAEVARFLRDELRGRIDLLVTVGTGDGGARVTGAAHHFDSLDDAAIAAIASMVKAGDTLLLKGSRGVGLERLIPALEAKARCCTTSG
ncbi:MAG: UDP-N-acetylmuramoyl-L-alanyl-D-glutamate--2,6-diaminopimelate ligase [Phycisphaerales bacterium]|nr:UDP-N-acetylmuramoyl-L-alanyl-D-glutamate--2,6-diaminopimelate ligase [Phycisphaerales bacterium]